MCQYFFSCNVLSADEVRQKSELQVRQKGNKQIGFKIY